MANYIYDFTIHCKGEQNFIDEFSEFVKKDLAGEYASFFIDDEFPFGMYFGGAGWRIKEYYSPFELLIQKFTVKTGKPLSFFFELHREQNSLNNSLRCGYAIFEDGEHLELEFYPFGKSNEIKKRLSNWFGIEDNIDDNAVDVDWRGEVEYQLENILHGFKDPEHVDGDFITPEIYLAYFSRKDNPTTFDELCKKWKVPDNLKEKIVELLKKGFDPYKIYDYIGDEDEIEKYIDILLSGKGFSAEELFSKVAQYTAKDMPDLD
jgi:hypothetical protein